MAQSTRSELQDSPAHASKVDALEPSRWTLIRTGARCGAIQAALASVAINLVLALVSLIHVLLFGGDPSPFSLFAYMVVVGTAISGLLGGFVGLLFGVLYVTQGIERFAKWLTPTPFVVLTGWLILGSGDVPWILIALFCVGAAYVAGVRFERSVRLAL